MPPRVPKNCHQYLLPDVAQQPPGLSRRNISVTIVNDDDVTLAVRFPLRRQQHTSRATAPTPARQLCPLWAHQAVPTLSMNNCAQRSYHGEFGWNMSGAWYWVMYFHSPKVLESSSRWTIPAPYFFAARSIWMESEAARFSARSGLNVGMLASTAGCGSCATIRSIRTPNSSTLSSATLTSFPPMFSVRTSG